MPPSGTTSSVAREKSNTGEGIQAAVWRLYPEWLDVLGWGLPEPLFSMQRDRDHRRTAPTQPAIPCNQLTLSRQLKRRAPQFQATQQLRIRGHDNSGQAHRDRAYAHRQIHAPADQNASCHRNGNEVV